MKSLLEAKTQSFRDQTNSIQLLFTSRLTFILEKLVKADDAELGKRRFTIGYMSFSPCCTIRIHKT